MRERARAFSAKWDPPTTPDNTDYEIVRVEQIGTYLIAEVLYPSCVKCSYEGHKLLVWETTPLTEAIKFREIDPHFREPSEVRPAREAPPPIARFPASPVGWSMAKLFIHALEKGLT